jgi:DNA-binding MarR family transcriptional regulator
MKEMGELKNPGEINPAASVDARCYLGGSLGYALHRARLSVIDRISQAFGDHDISVIEFLVLVVISQNPGLNQASLAEALAVERPRIVPTLNKLEKRGLAKRTMDAADGRIRLIQITGRGRQLVRTLQKREQQCQEEVLALLGKFEADSIVSSLWKLAGREPMTNLIEARRSSSANSFLSGPR